MLGVALSPARAGRRSARCQLARSTPGRRRPDDPAGELAALPAPTTISRASPSAATPAMASAGSPRRRCACTDSPPARGSGRPPGLPRFDAEHGRSSRRSIQITEPPAITRIDRERARSGSTRRLAVDARATTERFGLTFGSGLLSVAFDVSEERRRESELRDFAAVAAHDLREPLLGVHVMASLLGRRGGLGVEEHEMVRLLDDGVKRATGPTDDARRRPRRSAATPACRFSKPRMVAAHSAGTGSCPTMARPEPTTVGTLAGGHPQDDHHGRHLREDGAPDNTEPRLIHAHCRTARARHFRRQRASRACLSRMHGNVHVRF